ncbi:MAG: dTDP-glucose 4,6-dehydratase [Sporolactobacillus sp.]
MIKSLLITGGAGFIGLNFVQLMLESTGYQVTVIDKLTYAAHPDEMEKLSAHPRFRFIKGDISRKEDLEMAFDCPIDAIVHFAAESHVDASIGNAEPFIFSNVLGTYQVLEAARTHHVARMIHVSTDEVYGALKSADPAFTESSPIDPNNPYSATKSGADCLALAYARTYRLPVIVSRCSNNYGPYQNREKWIPTIVAHVMQKRPIPIYGDGRQIRDWLYVKDHCRALQMLLEKGKPGEIYNIGGHEEHTNREIAERIAHLIGSEPVIAQVSDRPGHDRRYAMNASKIETEIGWKPQTAFDEGLRDTVKWYQAHPLELGLSARE